MPVMLKAALPVLFKVIACAALVVPTVWLLKVKLVGLRLTVGPLPVPLRATDCTLPVTSLLLSVIFKVAVRLPGAVGVKVTVIVQLLPPAKELAQVVVSAKSPGLVPVNAMLLMARATLPVLLTVKA